MLQFFIFVFVFYFRMFFCLGCIVVGAVINLLSSAINLFYYRVLFLFSCRYVFSFFTLCPVGVCVCLPCLISAVLVSCCFGCCL
jgi:hypothetical protein